MKIVINRCYGGFGLSDVALTRYKQETGNDVPVWDIPRDDKVLVSIVEDLKEDSYGDYSQLEIISIPDEPDLTWSIEEYDGMEWIAEAHRTWS